MSRVVGKSFDKKCVGSSAGFTVASDQHDAGVEDTLAAVRSVVVVEDTGPARLEMVCEGKHSGASTKRVSRWKICKKQQLKNLRATTRHGDGERKQHQVIRETPGSNEALAHDT